MMNKLRPFLFLLLALPILLVGCSQDGGACNECLEITTKNVRYVDANGNNLIFGDQAIYNPNDITVTSASNEFVDVRLDPDLEVIAFSLEDDFSSYRILVGDSLLDALDFELAERNSEQCCGTVTFSIRTLLNGQEIDNGDMITIVK